MIGLVAVSYTHLDVYKRQAVTTRPYRSHGGSISQKSGQNRKIKFQLEGFGLLGEVEEILNCHEPGIEGESLLCLLIYSQYKSDVRA